MPASALGKGDVMSAKNRTPYSRLIAFAALTLAAGILSLRAYDLFGSVNSNPVGSSIERELTYLLEPITGAEKVRVSVSGRVDRTVLIMVDGEIASDLRPLRLQIENVLTASLGFDPASDTLTLTQFPFARGVGGSLTPPQIAELTGLGLLCALLLTSLLGFALAPQSVSVSAAEPRRDPVVPQPARLTAPEPRSTPELNEAGQLAETKPNETASLVRGWLSYAEE